MKFCKRFPRTSKYKARGKVFNKSGSNFPCPLPSTHSQLPSAFPEMTNPVTSEEPDLLGGPHQEVDRKLTPTVGHTHDCEGWVTCPGTKGYRRGKGGKPGKGPESRKSKSMLWKPASGSLCLKGTSSELC